MKLACLELAIFKHSKLYHRYVQSLNRLVQLNLNAYTVILPKKSEIVEEFFLQLWKSDFDDFLQITGNKCI